MHDLPSIISDAADKQPSVLSAKWSFRIVYRESWMVSYCFDGRSEASHLS